MKQRLRGALAAMIAAAVCGCTLEPPQSSPPPSPLEAARPPTTQAVGASSDPFGELVAAIKATTITQAQAHFADRTRNVYGSGHGTQINYTSADGRAYLWYPGNREILPGYWKVETRPARLRGEMLDVVDVCFRYGPNTYNPVTRESGGGWNCSYAAVRMRSERENVAGDPLGLAGRTTVPFVLEREQTTLDALTRRAAAAR